MRRPARFPTTAPFANPAFNNGTPLTSDDIINDSGVTGANVSDALDTLNSDKADKATSLTAGAGLTGGGDLSTNRTFDVVANADGSITVNANDVQVGVLATDAQHGVRGGGTQHAVAVAGGAAGFLSGTDKTQIDKYGWGIIEAETQTLINAMTARPTSVVGTAINDLITWLKSSGWWAEIGYLVIPTLQDQQASLLNWKDPTQTAVNFGATFTAYQGFTGDGVNDYIDTIAPTSVSGYGLNTVNQFVWCEGGTGGASLVSTATAASNLAINPFATPNFRAKSNFAAIQTIGVVANRNGLFHTRRTVNANFDGYRNGILIANNATVAATPETQVITLLRSNAIYSNDRILAYGIGGNSVATPSDLYDALVDFYNTIGTVHS